MKIVIEFSSKRHARSWASTFLSASDACEMHAEISEEDGDTVLVDEFGQDAQRLRSLARRITRMIEDGGDE